MHDRLRGVAACLVVAAALAARPAVSGADELPVFRIELQDGRITPDRIEVPAGTRIKLLLRNSGTTPVEFESLELRKEKVLGPGSESFVVIRGLAPGSYRFFDDFHPQTGQALLVAQ